MILVTTGIVPWDSHACSYTYMGKYKVQQKLNLLQCLLAGQTSASQDSCEPQGLINHSPTGCVYIWYPHVKP